MDEAVESVKAIPENTEGAVEGAVEEAVEGAVEAEANTTKSRQDGWSVLPPLMVEGQSGGGGGRAA